MSTIAERVHVVQDRLVRATEKAGRLPEDISLMAISKHFDAEAVREVASLGISLFGENRVQEAGMKIPECPATLCWHLVGHLQRNKIRPALELFSSIDSVDSLRLLEALQAGCEATGRRIEVLLEVNVSGEAVKFGFKPEEVPDVLKRSPEWNRIDVMGLMTIPPLTEDPEGARTHFRALRECRDRWQQETSFPLPVLSMGMSHDFEVAIDEGSNIVRIGSAIFGPRPQRQMHGGLT